MASLLWACDAQEMGHTVVGQNHSHDLKSTEGRRKGWNLTIPFQGRPLIAQGSPSTAQYHPTESKSQIFAEHFRGNSGRESG